MPRRARLTLPNIPQHIITRGNNRQPCFFAEEDYRFFLEWLETYARQTGQIGDRPQLIHVKLQSPNTDWSLPCPAAPA